MKKFLMLSIVMLGAFFSVQSKGTKARLRDLEARVAALEQGH